MILSEEEDLIEMHKQHVDEIINCEKSEMTLISEVDKSGSDVESYVKNLDLMLQKKMQLIGAIRKKVFDFNTHLQLEKMLQSIYQKKQEELEQVDQGMDGSFEDEAAVAQQDSEGMIMGQGNGNSNIHQNFLNKSQSKGGNFHDGLNGDNGVNLDDLMDDGEADENHNGNLDEY